MKTNIKLLQLLFILCIFCNSCSYDKDSLVAVQNGEKLGKGSPVRFQMSGINPNVFHDQAGFVFFVYSQQRIKFSIYSEDWQELRVLHDQIYSPGNHTETVSAENLASGIYYLVGKCENETQVVSFIHIE
ncbi:MAG: hypothetical protein HYZ42_10170 [Bacteroidetes bacterium]|nr:hypothetical protein [Bacteroidota bacterium]